MKQLFCVVIIIMTSNLASAQEPCESSLQLKKIIQKAVTTDGDKYSNTKSEYFILDLRLSEAGDSLKTIEFFRKNTSVHFKHIEALLVRYMRPGDPINVNIAE